MRFRLGIGLLVLGACFNCMYANDDAKKTVIYDRPDVIEIKSIVFDYEMINDDTDCIGTLYISGSYHENLTYQHFIYTDGHYVEGPVTSSHYFYQKHVRLKEVNGETDFEIVEPNMTWGILFHIRVIYGDNQRIYSDLFSINDFLKPEDYEKLFGLPQASIGNVDDDGELFKIDDQRLIIQSKELTHVQLFDTMGRCVYNQTLSEYTEIDLTEFGKGIVIAVVEDGKHRVSKKIRVR